MYCSPLVPPSLLPLSLFSPFCFHLVVEPCSRACKNIVDNMKLISPLGTLSPLLLWLTKVKFTHVLKFITGYRSGVCVHMNIGCVCVQLVFGGLLFGSVTCFPWGILGALVVWFACWWLHEQTSQPTKSN